MMRPMYTLQCTQCKKQVKLRTRNSICEECGGNMFAVAEKKKERRTVQEDEQ